MWARKRIDIGWSDIGYGLLRCLFPGNAEEHEHRIASHLPRPEEAVICFSVRSGFDMLLTALRLPKGSEVLLSALTLGQMAEIVRLHGLVPVPVDLDLDTMAPDTDAIERSIGPKTRALVVAHLFGARCRIGPIADMCRKKNILLIEDMAQAFVSTKRWGFGDSDVAMFSFGTIKTATAGGAAVLRVRDPELRAAMRNTQDGYPTQHRLAYALKVCKMAVLKVLAYRFPYATFRRVCAARGMDADLILSRGTRAFPGTDLLSVIRQKPHRALLALLGHRISHLDRRGILRRMRMGRLLRGSLTGIIEMPGTKAAMQTHWVFPVSTGRPDDLVRTLVAEGFDATAKQSMEVIAAPAGSLEEMPHRASHLYQHMIYLPAYPEMGETEVRRMARVLSDYVATTQLERSDDS